MDANLPSERWERRVNRARFLTAELRTGLGSPWKQVRKALIDERCDLASVAMGEIGSEDSDLVAAYCVCSDGRAWEFVLAVMPSNGTAGPGEMVVDERRPMHQESHAFEFGILATAAAVLREEGQAIDPIDYLETEVSDSNERYQSHSSYVEGELTDSLDAQGFIRADHTFIGWIPDGSEQGGPILAMIDRGGRVVEHTRGADLSVGSESATRMSHISQEDARQRYGPYLDAALRVHARNFPR